MSRVAEFMNSLIVPRSLRGAIRNYIIHRRSAYQEIGVEPDAAIWIKLIIYLGSATAVVMSIIAFSFGYVVLPAISTSVAVVCATLFWFRNSVAWEKLIQWSKTIFCCPCNYFKRPPPADVEVKYERRLRKLLFGRSTESKTDTEVQTELQNPSSDASSENQDTITIDTKSTESQNVAEL